MTFDYHFDYDAAYDMGYSDGLAMGLLRQGVLTQPDRQLYLSNATYHAVVYQFMRMLLHAKVSPSLAVVLGGKS